ncbi:hypothetical protein SDC9_185767 [bioreactor metagenome]|uniref:Uncharacterized protein n=1 Tax=bioreactor metagenome TaxID=1076179 RepID=A0A645HS81_9ZZZZ|nr:hypothetical protein [Christensenella sp.]MEA5002766.1 hypothetical protein [Christensenella sp.]
MLNEKVLECLKQNVEGLEMVDRVRSMLLEEQEDWLKRVGRIKELRNQKRI